MFSRRNKKEESAFDPDEILFDSVSMLRSDYMPEGRLEKPIERIYAFLFLGILAIGVSYLFYRAGVLQIRESEAYLTKSQGNRFLTRSLYPPRGVIVDRYGDVLVDNSPSFGVRISKKGFLKAGDDLRALREELSRLLGKPEEYFFEIGFPRDDRSEHLPEILVVTQDIPPDQFLRIAYAIHELPGVEVFENFKRVYEEPYAAAHVIGYLGKPTEGDLVQNPETAPDDLIGKSGVESYYDSILRGEKGKKIVETDALGHETRYKLVENSKPGASLELTIDAKLQDVAYRVFSSYIGTSKAGSVTALNPNTGEVLALVSYPSFDSNLFSGSLSSKDYNLILANSLNPFVNRPIAGEYAPGSTIKPMFASAALVEGVVKDKLKKIYDPGYIDIPNPFDPSKPTRFVDWRPHGWINFYDAIAFSANVYFYIVGGGTEGVPGLGIERLERYARAFGFGSRLGIDLYGEKEGLFPNPQWKEIAEPENPIWRIGDTYNTSIGQGGVKATPLQIASMTSVIANSGTLWKPYVMKVTRGTDGQIIQEGKPTAIRINIIPASMLDEVKKGMRQGVVSGTVERLATLPVPAAAKTGTAQIGGKGAPHAWVTVMAPVDDPEIVLTVMIENAGSGVTSVVPIARDILEWYFTHRSGGTDSSIPN